jgi:transposase InsO family protein
MITEKALLKTKAVLFSEKYGIEAALEAFNIKRRTFFNWKKAYLIGGKKPEALNEKKRTPKTKRKRVWDYRILQKIKELREEHPNLGKEKLYPELKEFCLSLSLPCPEPSTIGRLISDLGGLRSTPKKYYHSGKERIVKKKKRLIKPKDFTPKHPGHLVALDSIESRAWSKKRYVITFEDIFTRISLAMSTSSHASRAAKEFFSICLKAFPYPIDFVLTDNGSEFAKEFNQELNRLHLTHYHTYPRTPKMNAHVERFNRSFKEEFLNYHTFELAEDPVSFNAKILNYLIWYNTKRVHCAFQNKFSPVQYALKQLEPVKIPAECNLGWTHTIY